jgi:branched-chain amino acid transport system ATP-binding protein
MTDTTVTPLLQVQAVTAGYGDLIAIRDVDLTVARGTVVGLIGRNGAGKSTTLRAIAGLNKVVRGRVLLDGEDVSRLPAYRRAQAGIAFVPEGKRIFRERTVRDNLIIGASAAKLHRAQLHSRIEEAYALFPILGEFRSRSAGLLSGGQQQMLAIAQALMPAPQLLLLDEPSAGLAPSVVNEVLRSVVRLRDERGLGVLLVEQAADLALAYADDVTVLDVGRTSLSGRSADPQLRQRIERAYFGDEHPRAESPPAGSPVVPADQ